MNSSRVSASNRGSKRRSWSRSRFFWNSFSRSHSGRAIRKDCEARRRKGQVSLQQPLELEERLVVENHVVYVLEAHSARRQAIRHGVRGKARVVLFPREALLLGGGDDLSIPQQGGGAVVVEGGNAQDSHGPRRPQNCKRMDSGGGPGGSLGIQ